MKYFKLELSSFEDRHQWWFVADDEKTDDDFGKAVSEAVLETFKKLEDTVEDSKEVKKDYPLIVLCMQEKVFLKVMKRKGFTKLEPHFTVKGDSYSVLWETPKGEKKLTPLTEKGNLEKYILSQGVELSDENPDRLIFNEF